jgi:hypothetical protein
VLSIGLAVITLAVAMPMNAPMIVGTIVTASRR